MYAENQSDKFLTVAGLKVLGNVESQNISQIKRDIQETFDKTQTLTAQQKEYWNELANDNVITPVEKKQVKQELAIIEKTYTAIIKKAEEHGQEFNPLVTSYARAYRNLKDYFNELKLFDNMTKSTTINKLDFNSKLSEYYEYEAVVQSVFLENQTYSIRVLSGLDVAGQDGEIAIYRNGFYRWNGEKWQLVGGGNYLGCFDYIPEANIDDFFLVREDFTGQIKYKSNGKFLKSNGKYLVTSMKFKKGFIYKLGVRGWEVIELKSDHRYFVATEDLLFIGESITTNLQDYVSSRAPKYLGAVTAEPEEKTKGDYFTWAAESTEEYTQGKVYKWNGEEWELLDPMDTKNNQQFMTALTDILKTNATGEGYFSTVFASALIANTALIKELAVSKAFIENLQSQIITLQNGGRIQSENYEQGKLGFLLDSNGVFECSVGTFRGSIESGPLVLNTTSPGVSTFSFSSSDKVSTLYNKLKSYGITLATDTVKVNGNSEKISYEETTETTETTPIILVFNGRKENVTAPENPNLIMYTKYYHTQYEYKKTTVKNTYKVMLQNLNTEFSFYETKIEDVLTNTKYNVVFNVPYTESYTPENKTEIIDPEIGMTLNFQANTNATTFKMLFLPINTGNLAKGTIYQENGFLKIV